MQVVSVPPQFHAALEAEPHCLTLRCAIADWFEENGQSEAAECMRWLLGKGVVIERLLIGWAVSSDIQRAFYRWEGTYRPVVKWVEGFDHSTIEYAYERILTNWATFGLKSPACCVGVSPSEEPQ